MSQFFQDDGQPANGRMKVCLATTVYEDPAAAYTFSIQKTREALHKAGINTAYYLLTGNCHVDDGRNSVVQEFLLSDCTDLVFLDADVVWEPESLIKLCGYDVDIVGGIYPYRDPNNRESLPVLMFPGQAMIDNRGLVEVAGLPTGFMRIRRHVLEALANDAPKYWKRTDRRAPVPLLFERTLIDGTRLGGDLNFCRKWIEKGGSCYAAAELHLGHVATITVWDSLGASMRRKDGTTLLHMADRLRCGDFNPQIFAEARKELNNPYGALEDVLTLCAVMGRQAQGPIIEAGTGLTSLVLAASTTHKVYSLEHDAEWYAKVMDMARKACITNLDVRLVPIKDGWYQVPDDLPQSFALGLNDGPPRQIGSRMGFFERFGQVKNIICDDADDLGYGNALTEWANANGRRIDFIERAAILREEK